MCGFFKLFKSTFTLSRPRLKHKLEQIRPIQQHRATIGEQAYTGLSKTTPEQLSQFEALKLPKPARSAV